VMNEMTAQIKQLGPLNLEQVNLAEGEKHAAAVGGA
jgi:hypothetical protein